MNFFTTCDSNWEAKIDKVLDALDDTGYKRFFEKRNYGNSVYGIAIVLMCRDPSLNFKQRIRFLKKDRELYVDIMLDLNQFILIEQKEKDRLVAEKLIEEIPVIIAKYKFEDFNLSKFKIDLTKCMKTLL